MFTSIAANPIELPGRKRVLRTLVTLDAAELPANSNQGWAHVAMLGSWDGHSSGSFAFTQDTFGEMLRNFSAQSNPIPWDYEHDTFTPGTTGPKPASGWVRRLELRADGTELWALVDWTPRAAQMIRDGEYRYCSPVVDFESTNRKTGETVGAELLSVALTNNPFLDGQHPLQLSFTAASFPPPPAAEPKGPPPAPPSAHTPPPPQAADPAPPPPADAADAAQGSGAEVDANALLTALADASGLDKSATLAALMDMKDLLINEIQKTVSRDGTPAEARRTTMADDRKTEAQPPAATTAPATAPAAAPAAAPVVAAPPAAAAPAATSASGVTFDEIERSRDKARIALMEEQLAQLMAERTAEKKEAIAQLVDEKIRDGFVSPDQRDNAIWAFTTDRARAEQIYSNKLIPIGMRQSTSGGATATTGNTAAAAATTFDLSQFTKAELMTIDCLIGARKTREQAVQIVLKRRAN